MHEHEGLRRTVYEWAEELGMSASIAGAVAHLHGCKTDRELTREEFEELAESLLQGRWG